MKTLNNDDLERMLHADAIAAMAEGIAVCGKAARAVSTAPMLRTFADATSSEARPACN